jgi:gluconate 2-dehydrogenase gamma chain
MDRRDSLKALFIGSVATSVLVEACKSEDKKTVANDTNAKVEGINRMKEEAAHEKEVTSTTFFTPHEMATIGILADIIIPKDDVSGSATDAKVPDFIEFIVKDMPEHQIPMRGGLRWLDMQCLTKYGQSFRDSNQQQKMEMVDAIAWPKKAKPDMHQGVSFFNLMRNLTATGFYTSEIGVKDVGYMGNTPNQWNGVPADVLKQYGVAYSEKELKECVSFDNTKA